jgi:hypothetical protein
MAARFSLGNVFATPGALDAFIQARTGPSSYLERHLAGDWGALDPEDWAANERALVQGTRLLSAYFLPDETRLWIITEADRASTTILLPEEY